MQHVTATLLTSHAVWPEGAFTKWTAMRERLPYGAFGGLMNQCSGHWRSWRACDPQSNPACQAKMGRMANACAYFLWALS